MDEDPEIKGPHLFQLGSFRLHSGGISSWKICCEALTEEDWQTIAVILAEQLPPFGSIEGVVRGGLRLAHVLSQYVTTGPILLVDDVLTTGSSLEALRAGREAIGAVLFARGPCPSWIMPLFCIPPLPHRRPLPHPSLPVACTEVCDSGTDACHSSSLAETRTATARL